MSVYCKIADHLISRNSSVALLKSGPREEILAMTGGGGGDFIVLGLLLSASAL